MKSRNRKQGPAANDAGQVVELVLPSGRKILARRMPAERMRPLVSTLEGLFGLRGEKLSDSGEMSDGCVTDLAWACSEVLRYCFVRPSISFDPQNETEIHPRDVSLEDAFYAVRWAIRRD